MYAATFDFARLHSTRPERALAPLFRRVVIGAAVLAALLGFGFAHAVQGSAPAAYETVTVLPGDTLWDLAAHRYPNADVRQKVGEIERANGISDPVVHPGQTLKVPSS